MKSLLLVLLCGIVACVLAQTPQQPIWPSGWSTTVQIEKSDSKHPEYFRWWYDESQNKDRLDGIIQFKDEFYVAERVFDHTALKRYDVYYQEDAISCFITKINTSSLPKPDFSVLKYVGPKSNINGWPAYQWTYDDTKTSITYTVFDHQDNRELLRVVFDDAKKNTKETWNFFEYQVGPQSKAIFEIQDLIMAQCNE